MSFPSKQASREAKQRKSYIVHPKENKTTQAASSSPHVATGTDAAAGLYANLPDSVEIRTGDDEAKGRGVWCNKPIKRGSVILRQRPHVAALSTRCLPLHCSNCTRASEDDVALKRCSKCKTVSYCSPTCQSSDWKLHKLECVALQSWVASAPDSSPPGEAVRSLGRILWGRKIHGEGSTWWKEMRALQSHRSSISTSEAAGSYTQLAHALVRYIQAASPSELESFGIRSSGDLVELMSQFSTNTLTLASPSLSPLGTCVSPTAALFNHSCAPNAVIVFPGQSRATAEKESRQIMVHAIAIRDIPAGDEILTAYIDTSLPVLLRKRSLKETYNFECACPLCSSTETIDPREALWCPKSCGGLCPAPRNSEDAQAVAAVPRCAVCKAEFSAASLEDIHDRLRIGQDALDKATSLQFSDPAYAVKLTSRVIPLLAPHVPPSAHPLLAMLRLHQALVILSLATTTATGGADAKVLNDAIRAGARAVNGLLSVCAEGHPVRGIALAELGKLLAVDEPSESESVPLLSGGGGMAAASGPHPEENFPPSGAPRLALAIDTLKRALNELTIGFGEKTGGGEAGRNVRETIVRLEKEMNVIYNMNAA